MHNFFQSLCHECHLHKTALEQKGICRFFHKEGFKDFLLGDYAYAMQKSEGSSSLLAQSIGET